MKNQLNGFWKEIIKYFLSDNEQQNNRGKNSV